MRREDYFCGEYSGTDYGATPDELLKRDKLSLDLSWLRAESLESADMLASPEVIEACIVEDLQAALEQFMAIAEDLGNGK